MRRIYLAAKYNRMEEMRGVATLLRSKGHVVTANWINGDEVNKSQPNAAQMDIDDVMSADTLVLFTERKGSVNTGGGRHFEFGFAYAVGKKCVVVGEMETVFCHLTDVEVVPDLDNLITRLS